MWTSSVMQHRANRIDQLDSSIKGRKACQSLDRHVCLEACALQGRAYLC